MKNTPQKNGVPCHLPDLQGSSNLNSDSSAAKVRSRKCPRPLAWLANLALSSVILHHASGAGATTPFTTLEAESGTLAGGAVSSVIASGSVLPASATPEREASGLGIAILTATGQSVTWTNPVANANAIVIRACLPDASGGGGITATLSLYVNGTFRQSLTLSSKQSWNYPGSTTNLDDPNAGGTPYRFFNEDQAFIIGTPIAAGSTIMLKRDAADTASYYKIDCVDVESVGAAKTQPTNSLSITDSPYNADPTGANDSLAGFKQCVVDARAAGKSVWVPTGRYKMFSLAGGTVNLQGVTVNGAGMWYSVISEIVSPSASWGTSHHFDLQDNSVLRDVTVDQNAIFRGAGGGSDYALTAVGSSWLIERVWIQHGTNWLSGSNSTIKDSRVSGSWGDGINLNNGNAASPSKLGLNLTASNNFVRGAGDDNIATYSDSGAGGSSPLMDGTHIVNNTSVACYGANGLRVAGGKNLVVQNNLVDCSVANLGIRVGAYGTSGHPVDSLTMSGNVVRRSGGIMISATSSSSNFPTAYTNASVANNVISDSFRAGIEIGTIYENLTLSNNVITNPTLTGIVVDQGVNGTGTFQNNSVSGYTGGSFYNGAAATFTPTSSGNSWQSEMPLSRTGWVLTSSSNSGALSKAVDGSLTTRWDTNGLQSPGQWFQVDLGVARTFSQIVMDQSAATNDYPRAFQVSVSNDGVNWGSPIATGVGTSPATICTFAPQTARYLRVTQTGSATSSYWSIYEFNVLLSHSVNAGGTRIAPFLADAGYSGGSTFITTSSIDTSAVVDPAPEDAYKTERYGNVTYTMSGLTSGTAYKVRLHFSENYVSGSGQRTFNAFINGIQVLTNFDIFGTAGAKFKANVQEFNATANSSGQITIQFVNVLNNAKVDAIEILTM